jgi:ubiquinone/menaquinone biosynthesis C-methylase UbiE
MSKPDEMGLTPEAAEGYEQYFVPAIFYQWPPVLIEKAELAEGDDLLDIGCGTGVLSREAVDTVGETGSVTGFDLSESMLGVARRKAPQAKFHQGNVMSLHLRIPVSMLSPVLLC